MQVRQKMKLLLLTTCVLAIATSALADSWVPPYSRVFASEDGSAGVEALMLNGKPNEVILRAFTYDGVERKTKWEQKLNYVPHRVYVSSQAETVVTLDVWARVGYEHSLVVYANNGRTLNDFRLEDLLTAEEITNHVPATASSRWWSTGAEPQFSDDPYLVELTLTWGKKIRINRTTGAILRDK
jgi:hypothetical protein